MRCVLPDDEPILPGEEADSGLNPPQGADQTGFWFWVDGATLRNLGRGNLNRGRAEMRLIIADERARKPFNGPIKKPDKVRMAGLGDEAAILALLKRDIAENAAHIARVSEDRIMQQVHLGTRGKGGFCLVVDGPDSKPVAVALLMPTPWWWSDDIFLSETFLYVAPEARHTNAAVALLQYECWLSEQMSKAAGHTIFVFAGVTASRRRRSKIRLYHRVMNPCGCFCIFPDIELNI